MQNHKSRMQKLEGQLPGETISVELEILSEYITDDHYKILARAATIVERALLADRPAGAQPGPVMSDGEWELVEQAAQILRQVDQRYKANDVFKRIKIHVVMSQLSDGQLERLSQGKDLFNSILAERPRRS